MAKTPTALVPKTPKTGSVTCSLRQLLQGVEAVHRLAQRELRQQAAYDISKLASKIDAEVALYETRRKALVDKFGVDRDTTEEERKRGYPPTMKAVSPENAEAFTASINELQESTVTVGWGPIGWVDLVDPRTKKPLPMTAVDMMFLDPFFVGPLAEEKDDSGAEKK